jgi:hypothetical protein
MAKIIRLTESDLTRLVKRVIKEQTKGSNQIDKFLEMITDRGFKLDTKSRDKSYAYVYDKGQYMSRFGGKPLCFIKKDNYGLTTSIFLRKDGQRVTVTNNGRQTGFTIPQDFASLEQSL